MHTQLSARAYRDLALAEFSSLSPPFGGWRLTTWTQELFPEFVNIRH
jgi:hypothetical protein